MFTFNQYENIQINLDIKADLEEQRDQKQEEITKNNEVKKLLESNSDITWKYLSKVSEDEIVQYIYDYVQKYNQDNDNNDITTKVIISDLSITQAVKNDMWFLQSDINLSVDIYNYQSMISLLDFLTSSESKYKIFIDNFSYPKETEELWSFNINIPLKIYHN